MKTWKQFAFLAFIAIFAIIGFIGCGDVGEQPEFRETTITGVCDGRSATVQGTLTQTEWNGTPDKIKTALNGAYSACGLLEKQTFMDVFDTQPTFTIIVEKTSGYTIWKTNGDAKTLYVNFSKLDNLQSSLLVAFTALFNGATDNG